jgi:uncharacterized protein
LSIAQKIYLDSSAIVKRYVREKGTDSANLIFLKSDTKEISICFSFWNIGESIGVLDQYSQRNWITKQQHEQAVKSFAAECVRLLAMDALHIVPVDSFALSECWNLIEKYHIYEAESLQIVSAKRSESDLFLSADRLLLRAAEEENIECVNIESFAEVGNRVS